MEADADRLNSKLQNAVVIDLAAARAARANAPSTSVPYNDPVHISIAFAVLMFAVFIYFTFSRR